MSNQSPQDFSTPVSIGNADGTGREGTSPHFALGPGPRDAAPTPGENATANSSPPGLETHLVDQTKQQIRTLAAEIADLAHAEIPPQEFYQGFLTRMTQALASQGGAIWIREQTDQPLTLQYHINLTQTRLADNPQAQQQHSLLLHQLLTAAEPQIILPHSGVSTSLDNDAADQAGNPTDSLLVVGPLRVGAESVGLVEIFQRPQAGPTTQQGYLRFVAQMAELASDYLTRRHLKTFAGLQGVWRKMERFTQLLHQSLDTKQTVYTLANEGRRMLEVDRVSVALSRGKSCKIEAISGLDSLERRSDQVKRLNALVTAVVRSQHPLWYEGDDAEFPPQIERKLHEYIDKSHGKMLAIIPLHQVQPASDSEATDKAIKQKGRPLGALVVEQLKDSHVDAVMKDRVAAIAKHSEIALGNTIEHQSIFLMPVWKTLGRMTSLLGSSRRWKTLSVAALLTAAIGFLCLFPYEFGLGANGNLVPESQTEVFTMEAGVLAEIFVSDHGDTIVKRGDLLAKMFNNELEIEIDNLEGQIEKEFSALRSKQTLRSQLNAAEAQMLAPEISSLRQQIISLENELDLRKHQQKLLEVRSPIDGRVINWQVRQHLLRRPVQRGQHLMTIVDPDTQWQIELRLPERRVAHLMNALKQRDNEPLNVSFTLLSYPGSEFTGQIIRLDRQLEVHADDGNTVLMRVAFDNSNVPHDLLRSGTRVAAKIECGQRPIGYVLFHELLETIQTQWIMWF